MRQVYHLIGETVQISSLNEGSGHAYTTDCPGGVLDPCHVPTILLGEHDAYLKDIRRWCRAYDPLFAMAFGNPDTFMGATLLRLYALDAEICLEVTTSTDESSIDVYFPQFWETTKHD